GGRRFLRDRQPGAAAASIAIALHQASGALPQVSSLIWHERLTWCSDLRPFDFPLDRSSRGPERCCIALQASQPWRVQDRTDQIRGIGSVYARFVGGGR